MLERVWRKGNPLTLLVGMQTRTATMEDSVEITQKMGNRKRGLGLSFLFIYGVFLINKFKFSLESDYGSFFSFLCLKKSFRILTSNTVAIFFHKC